MAENGRLTAQPHPAHPSHTYSPPTLLILHPLGPAPGSCPRRCRPELGSRLAVGHPQGLALTPARTTPARTTPHSHSREQPVCPSLVRAQPKKEQTGDQPAGTSWLNTQSPKILTSHVPVARPSWGNLLLIRPDSPGSWPCTGPKHSKSGGLGVVNPRFGILGFPTIPDPSPLTPGWRLPALQGSACGRDQEESSGDQRGVGKANHPHMHGRQLAPRLGYHQADLALTRPALHPAAAS
jgi:hypothetical protein